MQFAQFYSTLYSEQEVWSDGEVARFLADLPLQPLSQEDNDMLDEAVMVEDLKEAVGKMKAGKSPEPTGFPCKFFKAYIKHLGAPLLDMIEEAAEMGSFPPDLRVAEIVVIPKPEECSSYRPISLQNVEVKALAKPLAERLREVIQ